MASKTPNAGSFIGGILLGLMLGGIVAMPVAVLLFMWIFSRLSDGSGYAFAATYALGAGLGVWAFAKTRACAGFGAGVVTGLAAGLLGSTALCNSIVGGLGSMH